MPLSTELTDALIGELAERRLATPEWTTCTIVGDLFRHDPALRSLVVEGEGDVWLLNRSAFHEELTGQLGFGYALYSRRAISALPRRPFVRCPASAACEDVAEALIRQGRLRDDDVLVDFGDGGHGVVPVAGLLERLGQINRRRASRLEGDERRLRALVEHSSDLTVVLNRDRHVIWANRPADEDPAGPFDVTTRVHPADRDRVSAVLAEAIERAGRRFDVEFRYLGERGGARWYTAAINSLLHDPAIAGIVVNLRDIDGQRRLQDRLRERALSDALTGIANRSALFARLDESLRADEPVGLAVLDLDGFKEVNDQLGHLAGDEVLRTVAGRISAACRPTECVARLGGDEFAVAVAGRPFDPAHAQRLLEAVSHPVIVGGSYVRVGVSIGYASSDAEPVTATQLVTNADLALYRAKQEGGYRVVAFRPEMYNEAMRKLELRARLDRAVQDNRLSLVYQPKIDLLAGRVEGFEALLRWTDPELGPVPPDAFIPEAEETGRIVEIGQWVLRTGLTQLAHWRWTRPDLQLAVNVSVRQLMADDFAQSVTDLLDELAVPPGNLEVEITETALISDRRAVTASLQRLQAAGVRIAVDDYGSGHASIDYLRRYPIDSVKVDRELIALLDREPTTGSALLRSITSLTAALGLDSVAEGIETGEQDRLVRQLGFDSGQGYHYFRPMPAESAEALLHEQLGQRSAAPRTTVEQDA